MPTLSPPETSFEERTSAVMQRVRSALGDLLTRLTSTPNSRAGDLVDVLPIDPRLAWKLVKIVQKEHPLDAVRYVPGPRGISLLLSAAARRPGLAPSVRSAKDAFKQFTELVQREAGDRKSFDMMVTGHIRARHEDADLEHRRGLFTHGSYVWGVQARAQIHTFLIQPSGDGAHLDAVIVRGFVSLRRIRPDIRWRITRFYTIDDTGHVETQFTREPLDPLAGPPDGAAPLLRPYCSQPLPDVRREIGPQGVIEDVLGESDVGNMQAVTCLTGEVIRRAEPCHPDERHACLGTKTPLRTPCETVVMDVFLRRDFFGRVAPVARLVSDVHKELLGAVYREADHLPFHHEVAFLGAGTLSVRLREMPRYAEMIQHCFDQVGWDSQGFDCYRVQMQFPPCPAALLMDCTLPPRP
ncbi:MAG TPA: hypothetical protein PKK06_01580 [Phycisphaerae bacterium]|nr:hypothetical protein [Phycisphaerae bacterium]HNU44183.1 hypothetical protein [Phycisphaerae bacterium]